MDLPWKINKKVTAWKCVVGRGRGVDPRAPADTYARVDGHGTASSVAHVPLELLGQQFITVHSPLVLPY